MYPNCRYELSSRWLTVWKIDTRTLTPQITSHFYFFLLLRYGSFTSETYNIPTFLTNLLRINYFCSRFVCSVCLSWATISFVHILRKMWEVFYELVLRLGWVYGKSQQSTLNIHIRLDGWEPNKYLFRFYQLAIERDIFSVLIAFGANEYEIHHFDKQYWRKMGERSGGLFALRIPHILRCGGTEQCLFICAILT